MNPRATGILAGVGIIVELLGLTQHGDLIFAVIGAVLLLVGSYPGCCPCGLYSVIDRRYHSDGSFLHDT